MTDMGDLCTYSDLVGHLPVDMEGDFADEVTRASREEERLAPYRRQALLDALLGSMDASTETPERQEARLVLFMEECLCIQPRDDDPAHRYLDALVRDRQVGDGTHFWTCVEGLYTPGVCDGRL